MRSSLHLAIVLQFHQPPTASVVSLEESFDEVYCPVLDAVEADERLLLNLHFGGRILEHALAHRSDFLSRIARLWRAGRVELLGGAFYDPVLAAIPERDAVGQLQFTANWLKRHLGQVPTGAWLALRAWDPALPRALGAAQIEWTLLDDAQFMAAGLETDTIHGHYTTERAGHPVSVFPIDRALSLALITGDAESMRARLGVANLAHQPEERLESVALPGERLVRSGRFTELLRVLVSEYHWLKTIPLARAFQVFPTRGRMYLPTGADPALAEWSRPAATRSDRLELERALRGAGMWDAVEHFVGRVVFENFLVKYGEANRLHKRMLASSASVDRLRAVLAERQRSGKASGSDGKARKVLERACDALWRAQTHTVYWHGGGDDVGIYDPRLRYSTTRQLMVAQRMVERALGDPARAGWSSYRTDHDADGNAEAVVMTPTLGAVVHAARGGTLWELDLRDRGMPLLTAMSPVEEPYDDTLVGNEVVLGEDEDEHPTLPPMSTEWDRPPNPSLARRRVDRQERGAFQDHFLGSETTLETFNFRQFRQLGDFAVEPWELMRIAGPESGTPDGRVLVGRSGVVKDVDRTLLLRIEKEYRFDPSKPRMIVAHSITNRSRETASSWHGFEWTLGIPSGDPANVVATTFAGEEQFETTLTRGPQDLGWLSWIELKDTEAEVAIVIQLPELLKAWWVPITSVHEGPDGWQEVVQGHTLLLHRALEIWGEDTQSMEIIIDFLR